MGCSRCVAAGEIDERREREQGCNGRELRREIPREGNGGMSRGGNRSCVDMEA